MSGRLGGRIRQGSRFAPTATLRPILSGMPTPEQGWTELTAPPTPFENGAPNYAVALDDGTILVGAGDAEPSTFWIYDPDADTYTPTASGPASSTYRLLVAGAFVAGNAYAVSDPNSGVVRFDSGSWTTRAGRTGFSGVTACTDDGTYLYVLDGGAFSRYDPFLNSWTAMTYPNVGASYSAIVPNATGEFLWQFDSAGSGATSKYDTVNDIWDAGNVLTPPPTVRTFMGAGVIDDKAYLAGGMDSGFAATDVLERYDLSGDSWETLEPMSSALITASACVQDGKLYVFGVEGSPTFDAKARVYIP